MSQEYKKAANAADCRLPEKLQSNFPVYNGKTTVYGVIGDPISHSFSPQIHGYFAGLCGINMAYVPFHVKGQNIPDALRGAHALGIRGLNVTVPHKKAVMPHLAHIDPMAQKVNTVNTLIWTEDGYTGHNTDYIGIQRTVASLNITFKDRYVAVLGAGGSAYAACIAAADQEAKHITIINRTHENAVILASHINSHYNIPVELFSDSSPRPDVVIQTTTVGFGEAKDMSPIPNPGFFAGVQLAFDIIYSPWETVFLHQAKKAGVPKVVNGFPMLVYQAAAAFGLWHTERIQDEAIHIKTLEKRLKEGLHINCTRDCPGHYIYTRYRYFSNGLEHPAAYPK